YSRAAMLALIASSLTMLLCMAQQRRKLIALMVLSAIVVALIYYIPSQHKQKSRILPERFLQKNLRIGIYLTSLEIFKDYPLTGVGYGGQTFKRLWKTYHPKIPTEWQLNQLKPASSPHSFFFDILVRLGIVGMALFAFLIIKTLQIQIFVIQTKDTDLGGWGSCLLSALVGTLIGGFFGDILSGPPWLNIFLLLAMTTIIWQLAKEKRNNTTTV
ncbi:MAG TPA: O-antigen ligase family protein, partial [Syntrophales bacterium]|nr:O-antigen ligase family protein [Syntrophales bacterium]